MPKLLMRELHTARISPGVLAGLVAAWKLNVLRRIEEGKALGTHAARRRRLNSSGVLPLCDGLVLRLNELLKLLHRTIGPCLAATAYAAGLVDWLQILEDAEAMVAHKQWRSIQRLSSPQMLQLMVTIPNPGMLAAMDTALYLLVCKGIENFEALGAHLMRNRLVTELKLFTRCKRPGVFAAFDSAWNLNILDFLHLPATLFAEAPWRTILAS